MSRRTLLWLAAAAAVAVTVAAQVMFSVGRPEMIARPELPTVAAGAVASLVLVRYGRFRWSLVLQQAVAYFLR